MLPIEFLLITVWPVIDMRLRCKSKGIDYPPGIPPDVSKVLELDIVSVKPNLHCVLSIVRSLYFLMV